MKQYLLITGERALGGNFKQTQKLEAVKVAARLPAKLCGKGWSLHENMVTSDQVPQDWMTHVLAV
jgi:hypothetical protein